MDIEYRYSKKLLLEELKGLVEFEESLIVDICRAITEWLIAYHKGEIGGTYESKTERLKFFNEQTISDTAISLIFSVLTLQSEEIQELVQKLSNDMRFSPDEWLSIRTSAEVIAACDGTLYDIHRPILGSGESFKIKSKVSIPEELKLRMDRCMFVPPMTSIPQDWTNPYNGGYDFIKNSIFLGDWFNSHNEYINLGFINRLQRVAYKLTPIVDMLEEPKEEWDSDTLKQFYLQREQSQKIYKEYKGVPFYFVWQYDKRGRIYSKGYDINIQGNEYRKASLEFANKEKLTERGIYWLKVAIANTYGLDKLLFDERVEWVDNHIDDILLNIDEYVSKADEPLLFREAIRAYQEGVVEGKPIGYIARLDATCSGPQLMSTIVRDTEAMKLFNVLGDSKRYDYYTLIAEEMYKTLPNSKLWGDKPDFSHIRKVIKHPIMTIFYNSEAKPKELLGDSTEEYYLFYELIDKYTEGARYLQEALNGLWQDERTINAWRLPDGHTAYCPVTKREIKRIELKEIKAVTKFMINVNNPNPKEWRSLAVNIIHSLDAWVCRTVCDNLLSTGIDVSPIHDSFGVHPNHCDVLRKCYRGCLARLYKDNIIDKIASDILGARGIEIDRPEVDMDIYESILSNENGYYIC